MESSSRSKSAPPCIVPRCEPIECYLYLAPGAPSLEPCSTSRIPPLPRGCVRVVCLSDTHNEHEGLNLPAGDVLIHTGDVLTESGLRYVEREAVTRAIVRVDPEGVALFTKFATWLGQQKFDYKVLVGGNHDLVLQGLGNERLREILAQHCTHGRVVYLENEEATLGALRVFGSPHADYSSHNDAFRVENPVYDIRPGVHVVATHMPGVLPGRRKGTVRWHDELVEPMLQAGALLHTGGHCHWAHGLYFAERGDMRIPCVVASVCDSQWLSIHEMASATGYRGDPRDRRYGGYNLVQPGIVCDLLLPEQRVATPPTMPSTAVALATDSQKHAAARRARSTIPSRFRGPSPGADTCRDRAPTEETSLLFFCPDNDPELPRVLIPQLEKLFHVVHVKTAEAGIHAVGEHRFGACVAKLGTRGNLGRDVIAALRSRQGRAAFVAIHSATAAKQEETRTALDQEFGISLFTEHGLEAELVEALSLIARPRCIQARSGAAELVTGSPRSLRGAAIEWLCGRDEHGAGSADLKPRLLLFAPSNDPRFAESLLPHLAGVSDVDVVATAAEGIRVVRDKEYRACVAKLGTAGNLGVDIIAAFRGEFGPLAFVAIHSATAAKRPDWQERLRRDHGVNLFVQHGEEGELAAAVRQALAV